MGNSIKEKLHLPTMIFCIIGCVLFVLGVLLCINGKFKMQIIGSEAVVTGIQTATDSDGSVISTTYTLTYNANRSDYNASIVSNDSDLELGDKMLLYYDFFDPTSVSQKRGGYYGYIALLLGLICVLKTGPRFIRIIKDNYL